MNVHRYDKALRRQWVLEKRSGVKSVKQICKEAGISRATLYNWLEEFPEQETSPETPARILGLSNLPTLQQYASGDYEMLLEALKQVDADNAIARKLVQAMIKKHSISLARACALAGISEETYGYKPRRPEPPDVLVHAAIAALLAEDSTRTFEQCYTILRTTHADWTRKQLRRIYREQQLYKHRTRKKRNYTRKGDNTPEQAPETEGLSALLRPGIIWTLGMAPQENNAWKMFIADTEAKEIFMQSETNAVPGAADLLAFLVRATGEAGVPRRLRAPSDLPLSQRDLLAWAMPHRVSLQMMSMNKEENTSEMQDWVAQL